jgi:hypothetical protein
MFFILGLTSVMVRSNLEIPSQISKFLSLYLLFDIGIHGGEALFKSGLDPHMIVMMAVCISLSFLMPFALYKVLRLKLKTHDAAAIAAIESMRPGCIAELEQPTSFLGSALSAEDRQTLVEARERVRLLGLAGVDDVKKHMKGIAPGPSLTIARSALCTKVSGFGNFVPYPTNVFRAGSNIRAIVYIELENFVTRAARNGDQIAKDTPVDQQVSVDISQSISIFQDAGGMLAWHSPPKEITDTSRSRRRDFYLIQQIELPRTLAIGRYNIKVLIKDLGNNAEAEVIIPISIVAQ